MDAFHVFVSGPSGELNRPRGGSSKLKLFYKQISILFNQKG